MKRIALFLSLTLCSSAFAGGTIGGGGSGLTKIGLELASVAFSLDHLPELRVDADTLRRAEARLSVDGVESVDMPIGSESLTVRRLQSSIVDIDITKKVLPQ